MKEVDADTKSAPSIIIPAIVESSLQGTALGNHLLGYSPLSFQNGVGVSALLRLKYSIPALSDPGNRTMVRDGLLDILGHLIIPMAHHHVAAIICQVMVLPPGDDTGFAAEFDQLKLSDVPLTNLELGDVVPPDVINPHITSLLDTWDRKRAAPAGQKPTGAIPSSSASAASPAPVASVRTETATPAAPAPSR